MNAFDIAFSCHPVLFLLIYRGPNYGYRGKVLLAFEENKSAKVGVRFDKHIAEGNDLGGLCEEHHGFFCAGRSLIYIVFDSSDQAIRYFSKVYFYDDENKFAYKSHKSYCLLSFFSCSADSLRPDTSTREDTGRPALNELFEVVPILL